MSNFFQVLTVSKQLHYVKDVERNVFNHLLRQSDLGIENRADLLDNEIVVDSRGNKVSDVRGVEEEMMISTK